MPSCRTEVCLESVSAARLDRLMMQRAPRPARRPALAIDDDRDWGLELEPTPPTSRPWAMLPHRSAGRRPRRSTHDCQHRSNSNRLRGSRLRRGRPDHPRNPCPSRVWQGRRAPAPRGQRTDRSRLEQSPAARQERQRATPGRSAGRAWRDRAPLRQGVQRQEPQPADRRSHPRHLSRRGDAPRSTSCDRGPRSIPRASSSPATAKAASTPLAWPSRAAIGFVA